MTLNRFRAQLQSRVKLLDMLINQKEKAVKAAPPGRMIISNSCKVQYFRIDEKTGEHIYISKKNIEIIKGLAQKAYDTNVLNNAYKEKEMLENLLKKYPTITMEEYFETLSDERKKLISPVWLPNEDYIRRWQRAPYIQKRGIDNEQCFLTNRGEHVRSKSEKIIADRLNDRNIPYRYEAELILEDGSVIHPDFTLLNMRTRTEVYLEHCGMMDNPKYANQAVRRINLYTRNGILLGDRLWITMETDQVPLDVSLLDKVINQALS